MTTISGINPNQLASRLFDSLFGEIEDELDQVADAIDGMLSEAQANAIRGALGAAWMAPMVDQRRMAAAAKGTVALEHLARRQGVHLKHERAKRLTRKKAAGSRSAEDKLFRAIVGHESGGRNVKNRDSGALGIGQVMPANIARWSKEILGRRLTKAQFAARPDLQEKIVRGKLAQYYQEGLRVTGSESEAVRYAAAKWYSGSGHHRNNTKPQYSNGRRYPSVSSYANRILAKYRRM